MLSKIFEIPNELISRYYDDNEIGLSDYRTVFMRDRDRVLYCTAFRRLAGKTQIYTIGSDDHKRNRLTHSLEVSQIARTISQSLGLNNDLTEAIALAHDLGHTPFGHAGEQMLHKIMLPNSNFIKKSPFYQTSSEEIEKTFEREQLLNATNIDNMFGFKHNIQSVRVAALLEDSYRGVNGENIGLNLTNYTLWGILNHSRKLYAENDVYPNYQNRFSKNIELKNQGSDAWSFEAYIVEIADDIAQWHHDLEDAIRGGALPIKKICETIESSLGNKLYECDKTCLLKNQNITRIDRKCISELSHIVVNTLVNDIVETSKNNLDSIKKSLSSRFKDLKEDDIAKKLYKEYNSLDLDLKSNEVISFSSSIQPDEFRQVIKGSVHHSRNVERMNEKGKYIIRKLFEAYYSHPQQLPDGPILHFMVDSGEYKNIDEAREHGTGEARVKFDQIMKNPKIVHKSILMRRICDHIASMTDRYAIEEYNNLYG